jgi:hypothetical protein
VAELLLLELDGLLLVLRRLASLAQQCSSASAHANDVDLAQQAGKRVQPYSQDIHGSSMHKDTATVHSLPMSQLPAMPASQTCMPSMMETASTASKSTALECLQVKLEEHGEDFHLFCTHEAKHHWRDGLQMARVGRNADAHLRCNACLQSVVTANVKPNLTSIKTCNLRHWCTSPCYVSSAGACHLGGMCASDWLIATLEGPGAAALPTAYLLKSQRARLAGVVLDIADVELGVGIIHLGEYGARRLAHEVDQHVQPPTMRRAYLMPYMHRNMQYLKLLYSSQLSTGRSDDWPLAVSDHEQRWHMLLRLPTAVACGDC